MTFRARGRTNNPQEEEAGVEDLVATRQKEESPHIKNGTDNSLENTATQKIIRRKNKNPGENTKQQIMKIEELDQKNTGLEIKKKGIDHKVTPRGAIVTLGMTIEGKEEI